MSDLSGVDFGARIRRPGAGIAVVELVGLLDGAAGGAMTDAYEQAVPAGVSVLVLDFHAVTYINSTGIALVVSLLAKARAGGVEVRACGLSDHFHRVFEITRLVDYLTVFADVEEAVHGTDLRSTAGG